MKKNLLLVVTLALVLVNLVLTGIIAITIIPETKKANELITKVCSAIDLELEAGADDEKEAVDLSNCEFYDINDGEAMTINLKQGEDGATYYASIATTVTINKEAEGYDTYGGDNTATYASKMKAIVNNTVSQYTYDEIKDDPTAVQDEICKKFQEEFGEDLIVAVEFTSANYQKA